MTETREQWFRRHNLTPFVRTDSRRAGMLHYRTCGHLTKLGAQIRVAGFDERQRLHCCARCLGFMPRELR